MPFEGMNFGLARPTVALESPMDAAMKGLAMQQAQQQVQQGGLNLQKGGIELQNAQQDQADQQKVRQLAQSQSFKSLGDLADAAEKAGVSPKTVAGMRQQHMMHQKEVAQLSETLGKVDAQKRAALAAGNEAIGKVALSADTPEKLQAGLAGVAQQFPEMTPKLQQYAQAVNPQNLEQIKAELKWNGLKLDEALTEIRRKEEYTGTTPALVGGKPRVIMHNKQGQGTPLMVDGQPAIPMPTANTPGVGGIGGGGGNGKVDDEYLNSLDPVRRDTIIKVGTGKYGGLDALKRTKGGQALIADFVRAGGSVSDVNNAVKWQEEARKTSPGSIGGTYLSVNKSLEHAQRALDVMDQFPAESASDGGFIDYWKQRAANKAWALANPGKASPLEKNWQITTSALLDETEKNILGGKPSVDQARAIEKLKTMPFTATKAEKMAAIQAVLDLTMGQYDAVEAQRQQAQGKFAKADSMLSPKSQKILAGINARLGREGDAPGAPTAPRSSLDAASPMSATRPTTTRPTATLKDGSKVQLSEDGKRWEPIR